VAAALTELAGGLDIVDDKFEGGNALRCAGQEALAAVIPLRVARKR